MADQQPLNPESPAVQAHLTILQGIIQRMADNSRACKTWCITLVSAVLILVARQGASDLLLLAGVPLLLFLLLDTYYLALERRFRRSYEAFVAKIHAGTGGVSDLYAVRPSGSLRGVGQVPVVGCHLALLRLADRADPAGAMFAVGAGLKPVPKLDFVQSWSSQCV